MRKFLAVLIIMAIPALGLATETADITEIQETVMVDQEVVPETVVVDQDKTQEVLEVDPEVQEIIDTEVLGDVQEAESFDFSSMMGIGIGLLLALSLAITYLLRFRKPEGYKDS